MVTKVKSLYTQICTNIYEFGTKHQNLLLASFGLLILLGGASEVANAQLGGGGVGAPRSGTAGQACNTLLGYMEGSFGALVAAAAGIGAIIAAAVGGFKAAWALLVVSVGAFILRSYISLFNGSCGF